MDHLATLVDGRAAPLFAVEATGSLHRAWTAELERRWPGSLRLYAPSETQAARAQLGSRRFKTDDRDCAALVWLLRQGAGRQRGVGGRGAARRGPAPPPARRRPPRLAAAPARPAQRALPRPLGPGRSRPRAGARESVRTRRLGVRRRVRRPSADAAVAAGSLTRPADRHHARFWVRRSRRLLAPADAELRARRLGREVERWLSLRADIAGLETELAQLLNQTDGQILTSLPGVAVVHAAGFAAHTLPIDCWTTPEHLYSATGLAPASYQSHPSRAAAGSAAKASPNTATR